MSEALVGVVALVAGFIGGNIYTKRKIEQAMQTVLANLLAGKEPDASK